MMVLLTELYLLIPLSVNLAIYQGHSNVTQFQPKILSSYPVKFKLCTIVVYVRQIKNIPLFFSFLFFHLFKGDNSPHLRKNSTLAFFLDTITARSLKLCMVMTLLRVYIFILGLMTLILFQDHRYVRNVNCRLCFFRFLSTVV